MDLRKYLALFVSEAGEHLGALGADLVRVEQVARAGEPPGPVVDAMFRRAHSLKGMASSMEQEGIARLAHGAEDLLGELRRRDAAPSPEEVDLLLATCDALQGMVARASAGEVAEPEAGLVERLEAAVEASRIAGAIGGEAPAGWVAGIGTGTEAATGTATGTGIGTGTGTGIGTGTGTGTGIGTEIGIATPTATGESRSVRTEPSPPQAGGVEARAAASPEEKPSPRHRFSVEVRVAEGCPVPAVRAFLVLKKLSGLGGVVEAAPGAEELRAGRIPERRLRVVLETAEGEEAIARALRQISDLAEATVREAEAAPRPAAAREAERGEPARTLRVRTDLLDHFLDLVGELLLASARIREVGRAVPEEARARLEDEVGRLHATVKDLHDKVMAVRMTPLSLATDPLPRAARDLARRTGKQVEVEVQGQGIEVDRAVLDEIADPLLHLLRNAVDHGIEAPHLRLLSGKPATGRVVVSARRERDRVIVEIRDDGKGMDAERLRRAAVARGALSSAAAAALSVRECLLLACLPGLSTADAVTDVSGRGVGMDAVKRAVEGVGGALELEATPGLGTTVTLRLPLTVAVQPVLLVGVGDEVLALPIAKVHGAAHVDVAALDRSRGEPVLPHGGRLVPVRELSALLGFGPPRAGPRAVVVADVEGAPVGLAVDALLGQQEAVLKPVAGALERVAGLSAVTVLGNGRPVFVLDVQRLVAA